MPAYIISRVNIHDSEIIGSYMERAPKTVKAYGGKYLARTQDIEVLEGAAEFDRMVVLEFPDKNAALAWYNSQEYRDLRSARWEAASAQIVILPGEII
jgi:uncharacterized protein (DUF1330 family)